MANHASHAALPYPVRKARFTIPVPYRASTGIPTDPTTPDTEVSLDGAAFADCAEEVSTVTGSNGFGYITLSGAETDASLVELAAKVASGPLTTLAVILPRVLPIAFSGTASAGAAGTITLAGCPAITDLLIGCIVRTTGGTGGGGTGGANNQARMITAYTSGLVATVVPNWETTPDNTTTFEILITEHSILRYADIKALLGTAWLTPGTAGTPDVNAKLAGGTAWGSGAITAASIAADAITAAKIADGAIDAGALATDAVQEIRDAITGGAYAFSTDANGRIRIVDGTGAGELDTVSGGIAHVVLVDTVTTNTDMITAAAIRTAVGLATANLDTQLDALPTNGELATALGTADDAVLAAIAALNNLSQTNIRTAVGLGSANLDTQLSTIDDFLDTEIAAILAAVDTEIAAIKAVTDQMAFGTANRLNVQVYGMEANTMTAGAAAADFGAELRALVTGGAYPLDTDANGRIRIVDGTAAGELDTASGLVKIAGTIQTLDSLNTAILADNDVTQALIAALNNLSSADIIAAIEDSGQVLVTTTIATLATQISFTIAAGSADNDAYNGATIVIEDASTAAQKCVGSVLDYVGSTRTVTLASNPGVFTMAVGDKVRILPAPTVSVSLDSGDITDIADQTSDAVLAGLGSATIEILGPVLADGTIVIVQGDDYYNADGRALAFTFTGITADYTSGTAKLKLKRKSVTATITGTIDTATGATRVVHFDIPGTTTDDFEVGDGTFEVEVTLSGGHVTTPAQGVMHVLRQVT